MKVAVKKIDALRRELNFEIPKERVKKKLEEVFEELGRVAKIKGFRPGKAPRHLVEAQHGALAREEAVKKLIPEVYREGIEQEKLAPLDLPEIEDVNFKDGIVTFKALVDIKPEIKLGEYKGITVKRKDSKVTDEDVAKTLEYFKKSTGDEKAEIDDKFVRGLGYPNLQAFKESLTRQMEIDKDRQNRVDVEHQIVEALLKDAKFAVPQSLVKRQLEYRLSETQKRLKDQGMSDEDLRKKEAEMRKELQEPVERDVKIYLVLDKIAHLEGLHVHEGESLSHKVMEFLLKEANWQSA